MKTNYWYVNENEPHLSEHPYIKEAAELLKQNENVAFPTETVYGLGGNALSDDAITKIFKSKERPGDNPLIVHVSSLSQLDDLVEELSDIAKKLIETYWPGPITLVLPAKEGISSKVTAGLSTVAIRMPNHPIALALIESAGIPIAAPSANLSGRPSPTSAQHVKEDLNGKIAGILDGGSTGVGVESTVVDCSGEEVTILRPGGITREQLEMLIPNIKVDPSTEGVKSKPKSPGMKYKHYAPRAPLFLVDGNSLDIQNLVNEKKQEGLSVGVLTTEEGKSHYSADYIVSCGQRSNLETVARDLYKALRAFDETNIDIIFSEIFPKKGMGVALMNRLLKAADGKVLK